MHFFLIPQSTAGFWIGCQYLSILVFMWRVSDTSSRSITKVKHTCPQPVTGLVFTGSIPVLHTNLWFQKHLIKQLWPPDGCRSTEGRLSTTLAEISFNWIDLSEWWWREKWWTSRESLWWMVTREDDLNYINITISKLKWIFWCKIYF